MKQLYCCPSSLRGLERLTKTVTAMVVMFLFVISGTAINTYYEVESNSNSTNNEGSSINNLLNLTAKLDATEAFSSFSNGDEFKLGGDGDCLCPDGGDPTLSIDSETFSLQCPDEVPEPPVVTAMDDCGNEVEVDIFQFSGANGDVVCSAQDAIGENADYWAIWLPTLPDGYTDQWRFLEDGSFNEYPDSTAILTGTVASILNPDRRFKIHIKLAGSYDWPTWNSFLTVGNPITNRIYKDALGFGALDNNFEDWSYYLIDETASYLVGEGDLEGAYLELQHAPSNLLFGAQVGLGANDVNGNYGLSSWFTYTGFMPDADGQMVATSGQGDVNVDLDCGQPQYQCSYETDYTYVAIDDCGNASTATLVYEVNDTIAPVLSGCPEDMTVECDAIPTPAVVTAIDNCIGEVEVSYSEESADGTTCPQEMTITRVWAAEDSCGNRNECVQIITVIDTTSPVIQDAPADVTIECGEEIPPMADLLATDNCDDDVEVLPASSTDNETQCPVVQVITRSWTAYDDCGNTSTVSQTITIQDTTAPDIMCPADATVECGSSTSPDVTGTAIATENCSTPEVGYNDGPQYGDCPYSFERTWTAYDDCGNSSSCVQIITVEDTTAPSLSGGDSGTLIVQCDEELPQVTAPTAYDLCAGDLEVSADIDENDDNSCAGSIVYTWTATDDCGNTAEQVLTVLIVDSEAPTFDNCPEDEQYACADEVPDPVNPTASDNCDEDVDVFFFQTDLSDPDNSVCELSNATEITGNEYWSIWVPGLPNGISAEFEWDENGAQALVSGDEILITGKAVNVDDDSYAFEVYLKGEYGVNWAGWNGQNTTSPPIIPRTYKDDNGFAAAGGNLWTTWDYYEIDGNNSYLIGQGSLAGSQLSASHAPTNYYFGLQVGEAADNKTAAFGLSSWFVLEGTVLGEPFAGTGDISSHADCSNPGTACGYPIFNVWTAVDDCGNVAVCEQTINVIDDVAPVIECPDDITIECTDSTDPSNTGMATATDNCNEFVITYLDGPITGSCPAQFTRVWAATDSCDNRSECPQIIYIDDSTAPTIDVEAMDVTVECDGNGNEEALAEWLGTYGGAAASDNCGDVTWSYDCYGGVYTTNGGDDNGICELSNECGATGSLTVHFIATDECDNTSETIATFTVEDTTPPSITADADATVDCDEEFDLAGYDASDSCSEVYVDIDSVFVGTCGTAGVWTLTYTATDDCGNSAQDEQIITVEDNEAPVINLPDDTVGEISCEEFICDYDNVLAFAAGELSGNELQELSQCVAGLFEEFGLIPLGVDDNCDDELAWEETNIQIIVHDECTEYEGSTNVKASFICWFDAEDECGNEAESVYTVLNIVDFTPPYFVGIPEDTTAECDDIDRSDDVSAFDDCDGEIMFDYEENEFEQECAGQYILVRTWTATDECGNSYSDSQQITVIDTTAPEFDNSPADLTVECDEVPVPVEEVTATDNCDNNPEVTMNEVRVDGDCDYNYTLNRTYTATDDCDNTNTYTQIITVQDTTAPEFVGLEPVLTVECDDIPEPSDDVATDNCGDVDVVVTDAPFSGGCAGAINRTYTATDECGNSSTYLQIINLIDETAPVLDGVPDDLTLECDEKVPGFNVTATDNCDDVEVVMTEVETPGCSEATYSITYTFTATDECENSVVDTYTLTVVDTTPPSLYIADDATVECGDSFDLVGYEADDNCGGYEVVIDSVFTADCGNSGNWVITYTATDDCDNSTVAAQNITIVDTTSPVVYLEDDSAELTCDEFTCGYDVLVAYAAGELTPAEQSAARQCAAGLFAEYGLLPVGVEDNCDDEISWNETDLEFVVFEECQQGVTAYLTCYFQATDDCGNTSETVSSTIYIIDVTPPSIEANDDSTVECGEDFDLAGYNASDDCGFFTVEVDSAFVEDCGDTGVWTITYTATDHCGNSAYDMQTITIVDTTAPEFVGLEPFLSVECDEIPEPEEAMTTDDCGDVDVSVNDSGFSGGCEGAIQRVYTATDECGNSTTYTQIINIFDETAPVLDGVPDDLTLECDQEVPEFDVTASDNCLDEVEVVVTTDEEPGCSDATYAITYTFTATDDCDNSTVDTYTLTVVDTTPPSLEVADDVTIECDEDVPAPYATAADNCGGADWTVTPDITDQCGETYTMVRTYVATDDCGNSTVATQTVTVVDTTAPVVIQGETDVELTCEEFTCGYDVLEAYAADELTPEERQEARQCAAGLFAEYGLLPTGVEDNCDEDLGWTEINLDFVVLDECENGLKAYLTCYFRATDECGNSSETVSSTIYIIDVTAPVIEAADDAIVECGEDFDLVGYDAYDDCGELYIEIDSVFVEDCGNTGVWTITYTATDRCGNSAYDMQTITIVDTTAPEFVGLEPFLSVECDEIPEPEDAMTTDDCGDVDVSVNDSGFSGGCEGAIQRVYTATDECGNSTTYTQIISIFDETAPVLDGVPDDLTLECDQEVPEFDVTASDNCVEEVEVIVTTDEQPGCSDATYSITYTFTATDDCDNSVVDTYTLTVVDTTAPELEVAGDETVECDESFDLVWYEAYDNCGGYDVDIDSVFTGDCGNTGNWVITYTATDDCDNSTVATQNITVVDTTAPEWNFGCQLDASYSTSGGADCPADAQISLNVGDEITVDDTWTAGGILIPSLGSCVTDNCTDDLVVRVTDKTNTGDDCTRTLTITFEAEDECGNTAGGFICTYTFTDDIDPVIDAADDATVECGEAFDLGGYTASDNCGEFTVEIDSVFVGDCGDTGVWTLTYTATDNCGNSASDSQTITIVDTTAPEFDMIPPFITVECDDIPDPMDITATDNCGTADVTVQDAGFSGGCEGAIERVYTATDECGNSSTYTQIISVIDITPPTITCPEAVTLACNSPLPNPDISSVTASDNCSEPVITHVGDEFGGDACTAVVTRTYMATDDCDNSAICTQVITIPIDFNAPVITCPVDITLPCNSPPPAVDLTGVTATDGCSEPLIEYVGDSFGGDFCTAVITRTFKATDDCGNSSTCEQIITIPIDFTAPTIEAADDVTVECDEEIPAPDASTEDGCSGVTWDVEVTFDPGCGESGVYTRIYTATDDCGNTATDTQLVTIVDTTGPEFDPGTVPGTATVECDDIPAPESPTATDNCDDADDVIITYGESEIAGDCDGEKTITRTWTAEDDCGNTTVATQTINVVDTTAPEIEEPQDETYVCGDEIPGAPDLDVSDNCSEYVDVVLVADTVGNTYPYLDCEMTTGEAFSGEDWSMFLTVNGVNEYFVLDEDGAQFTEVAIGGGMFEATISGTVVSENDPDKSWLIDVTLINKRDYTEWTSELTIGNPSVPRQPKAFSGFENPGDELGWDYWEVDATRSQLIGLNDFAGDILALAHAPANYLFGFQVGENANGYAPGFGVGGWFLYSGTINGESYNGQGDLAFQADCPPCEYTITRTWTATDDCGNSTVVDQVITVNAPENIIDGNDGSDQVAVQTAEFGFVKAYPNPTGAQATLVYRVPADVDVIIEVVNPSGKAIDNVFNGRAYAGYDNFAQFDGTAYDNGMYVVRMTTENNVFYQKVMLQK